MLVWGHTVDDDLKELISTTYINKIHLLFGSLSHKNSIVKYDWLGIVMGWVTFWEASWNACGWGQRISFWLYACLRRTKSNFIM